MPSALKRAKQSVERKAGHVVFGNRKWVERQLREVAGLVGDGRVLEIGSGRHDYGQDAYSMKGMFASSDFVQSDFNAEYGHLVVDVTTMDFDSEFDAILCVSVLEHVAQFWEAIPRMHAALRPGGRLILSVPMVFPYHDEPADFWRFTSHGVRSALGEFSSIDLRYRGPRRLPFTLFAIAQK